MLGLLFYHLKRVSWGILLSRGMFFCLLYLDTVKDCQKPNKSRIHYNVLGKKLSRHFRLFICFSETKRQQWWKRWLTRFSATWSRTMSKFSHESQYESFFFITGSRIKSKFSHESQYESIFLISWLCWQEFEVLWSALSTIAGLIIVIRKCLNSCF